MKITNAKKYLSSIQNDFKLDPDMFLRGQAVNHGIGVEIKHLIEKNNDTEVKTIIESIEKIHSVNGIPYDEIAILMFNGKFRAKIPGWESNWYSLEKPLRKKLIYEDIPYSNMSSSDEEWADHYGEKGGVKLIKFGSVLGLDFRGVIVCGLLPLGYYDKTKKPN